MKQPVLSVVSFLAILICSSPVLAKAPMAKLCGMCHEPEPGVMMGFLENIAIKSGTIQMDFMTHKEVVKFNKDTTVKYVKDFKDIRNYKKKGFQINYVEKNGDKLATEIIRFDILKVIEDDEKLSRSEFKMLRQDPKVRVYDVRPPMKYKMGHIPGAGLIPAPAFDKFTGKLPEDKSTPVVFYGVGGCLSPTALMKTKALGYDDVRIYIGGFPDWSKHEFGTVSVDWLKMAISKDIPHVLIDLRPGTKIAKAHIKGAVAIEYATLSASKDNFPERKKAPIIFYGQNSKEAAEQAVAWGYKAVRILPVTFSQWKESGGPVATGPAKSEISYVPKPKPGTIGVEEFENIAEKTPATVTLIDVRNPDEFDGANIKGTLNIPVDVLGDRLAELDKGKEVILFCNSGIRAEMAHTVLQEKGIRNRYLDAIVTFEKDGDFDVEEN
jgi:rhodanese-related sulfurtransferase